MADSEGQIWPLSAPAKLHNRRQENPTFKAIRPERTNKCFVYVFSTIVFFCIAVLVFAILVLRVKSPQIKLTSVSVKTLKYTSSPPSFNVSLSGDVTIKNPNFGNYEFQPAIISFIYSSGGVGSTKVVKGLAKVKKSESLRLGGVEIRSTKLPEGPNSLEDDMNSGMVKLTATGKVSGRVSLWKIINKRKTGKMDCTMTLVLKSKTIFF